MDILAEALSIFEGETRRLFWLPAITLGYLYTVTGVFLDFALGVGCIAGAKLVYDMMDSNLMAETPFGMKRHPYFRYQLTEYNSGFRLFRLGIVSVVYAIGFIWSIHQLYRYFDPQNVVLVGLAMAHWGLAAVIFMNITE